MATGTFLRKCFIVSAVLCACLSVHAAEVSIKHVGEFYSLGGTVQFLPGGYIIVTDVDGKSKQYVFNGSSFVASKEAIPPKLRAWVSFEWEGVDYLNQINRQSYDPGLDAFVPKSARVKQVISVNRPHGKTLFLVCYTTKVVDTPISVVAVLDEEADPHKPMKFRRLWKKVLTYGDYGQFEHQSIPGVGDFILLYSAYPGGSSVNRSLDVYKLSD